MAIAFVLTWAFLLQACARRQSVSHVVQADEMHTNPRALIATLQGSGNNSVGFSRDLRWLAVGSFRQVSVYNVGSGLPTLAAAIPGSRTNHFAFSLDSKMLAVGCQGHVEVYDMSKNYPQLSARLGGSYENQVEFSSDSRWLAVGSFKKVTIYSMSTSPPSVTAILPSSHENYVAFSDDSQWLAVGCWERVHIYSMTTNPPFALQAGLPSGSVKNRVVFSPGSQWLAVGTFKRVSVYDMRANPPALKAMLPSSSGNHVAFSRSSRWLAVGRAGSVNLYDLNVFPPTLSVILPSGFENRVAFSQDAGSRWLAVGSFGKVDIYDIEFIAPGTPNAQDRADPVIAARERCCCTGPLPSDCKFMTGVELKQSTNPLKYNQAVCPSELGYHVFHRMGIKEYPQLCLDQVHRCCCNGPLPSDCKLFSGIELKTSKNLFKKAEPVCPSELGYHHYTRKGFVGYPSTCMNVSNINKRK